MLANGNCLYPQPQETPPSPLHFCLCQNFGQISGGQTVGTNSSVGRGAPKYKTRAEPEDDDAPKMRKASSLRYLGPARRVGAARPVTWYRPALCR
eukprot:2207741-Rhodomonas_salina.1